MTPEEQADLTATLRAMAGSTSSACWPCASAAIAAADEIERLQAALAAYGRTMQRHVKFRAAAQIHIEALINTDRVTRHRKGHQYAPVWHVCVDIIRDIY